MKDAKPERDAKRKMSFFFPIFFKYVNIKIPITFVSMKNIFKIQKTKQNNKKTPKHLLVNMCFE